MSSQNLLVVDGDPAVHELLSSVLRREDRHIVGAYDGRVALDEMKRAAYDLLVVGTGPNGADGIDLLRRARRARPDVPVIVTATHADPEHVVRAIRENAYSYFHKPLPLGALADMVNQALLARAWEGDIEIHAARPEWIIASVRCKLDAAERIVQFLREVVVDMPTGAREDVAAAFRELLLNAIEHGGGSDEGKTVRISLVRARRSFVGYIRDPGPGFSLGSLAHAAVSNPDDSPTRHVEVRAELGQRPGGFGILMTRNMVDELVYSERGNEVLFVKYFP